MRGAVDFWLFMLSMLLGAALLGAVSAVPTLLLIMYVAPWAGWTYFGLLFISFFTWLAWRNDE